MTKDLASAKQNELNVNPWVKWLFLASSLSQVLYFIVWLMIQIEVIDSSELNLSMAMNMSARAILTLCATILLLKCTDWKIKVCSWVVALNRFVVLLIVIPWIRTTFPGYMSLPEIFFYLVLLSDFFLITSKKVRKKSLLFLIALILLDFVSLTINLLHVTFSDLLIFWSYSVLMSSATGLCLFFFYKGLEK